MAVQTRVEPIDRDVRLIIDETLSPAARSRQFASNAGAFILEGDEINRRVLGRVPPRKTFVDGREGAPLESVRPDGVIVAEWELVSDVLVFIADQLRAISPVRSGRYQASHTLFADGTEVPVGNGIPVANEYVFLSDTEYSIKIEGVPGRPPQSKQAPKGVYQITALKANGIYGNTAKVRFEWRKPFRGGLVTGKAGNKSDGRVPAIIVTIR
jgi:hypothetical protein